MDVGEQVGQRRRRFELVHVVGIQGNELTGCRRRDSKSARLVAIDFQEFDFEHDFAAGALELLDELTGKREPLRRVAHGDGAAASVDIDASSAGDVAQDTQQLGSVFRRNGRGEWKSLFGLQAVLPPLLRRVGGDKEQGGVQGAPKRSGLSAQKGNGGIKIHIIQAQLYVPGNDIRVKSRLHAE